jgi:hypothetical protein
VLLRSDDAYSSAFSRRLPLFSSLLTVGNIRTRLPPLVIPLVSWVVFGSCLADVCESLSLTRVTLDFLCGGQMMVVNRAALLERFLQRWFCLVGLGFLPYSVSSFKHVLSKMRFPIPFTSFPLFSLLVTFVNVSLLLVTLNVSLLM